MKRLVLNLILLSLLYAAIATAGAAVAQDKSRITVEWIYSAQSREATARAAQMWLTDGTALLYDYRKPEKERTFERLSPATGSREPLLEMRKALASLESIVGKEKTPAVLSWPSAFDPAGKWAVYIFDGDIYLLNLASAQFRRVTQTQAEEKAANFSPDGSQLAFVRNNDLYAHNISENSEKRLTQDGSETRLNGTLSWVYWEELFGRRDIGYWWSPDSKAIAYLQTDDSPVSVMYYPDFRPYQPRVLTQRYPKAGQPNPFVRVGMVTIADGKTTWADIKRDTYEYIVRVKWLPASDRVSVQTLNRAQDELDLYFVERATGSARHVLKERDAAWVNLFDDLYFLKNGNGFIWTSERSGYAHLYLYTMEGKLSNQITKGEWAIRPSGAFASYDSRALQAVDESGGWLYFTAAEKSSLEQHLYRIRLDGSGFERLTKEDGFHRISFSPDARYYFDDYSNISTPPSLSLYQSGGAPVQTLAPARPALLAKFEMQYPQLMTIPAADGFQLPAQLLKPKDFDPQKKYPVIMYVYGGPSSPTVFNAWSFSNYFDQILLDKGYLVMSFDNRSSANISKTLESKIKGQMYGDVELNDLLAAVKWLKSQPYVDGNRLGIWGWSGGGTYTLLAMTRSKEFKAGIAVAAGTDWRFYDTRWTEFSMKRPQDNPEGYQKTSLVAVAKDLHGRLLLVHGTYDDNVHIQNAWAFSDELIKAGKTFDMMIYPMRKHGIEDTPARIHLFKTMVEFWTKNL